jgi:DHA2 family methylenomycin A resistance protein-like MFS transporter
VTTYDWRWVFTINLPVYAAMLVFLVCVSTSPKRPQPFDWMGQVLAAVGLAALVYGLIDGGHAGFGSGLAVLALAVAVISLVGFVVVQSRVRHPMMPLDLFQAHGFRLALPVGFRVHGRQLRERLRGGPVYTAAPRPVAAERRARVPAVGLLRDRRQPSERRGYRPLRRTRAGRRGLLSMVVGLTAMLATAPVGLPWLMAICIIPIGAGGSLAVVAVVVHSHRVHRRTSLQCSGPLW